MIIQKGASVHLDSRVMESTIVKVQYCCFLVFKDNCFGGFLFFLCGFLFLFLFYFDFLFGRGGRGVGPKLFFCSGMISSFPRSFASSFI